MATRQRLWIVTFLLLVLVGGIGALAFLWGSGLAPLELTKHFWTVVSLAVVFGGLGGLAFDIAEPLRPTKAWKPDSFDNRTGLPRFADAERTTLDWGFAGPVVVGIVAALAAVFVLAVNRPPAPATPSTASATAATLPPTPYVNPDSLIVVALVAGFAGPILLRAARSRLVDALKAANVSVLSQQGVDRVANKAQEAVAAQPAAVSSAVEEETRKLLVGNALPSDPSEAAAVVAGVAARAVAQVAQETAASINQNRDEAIEVVQKASGIGNPQPEDF